MGGMVLETNMNEIVAQVELQNRMEKSEVSGLPRLPPMPVILFCPVQLINFKLCSFPLLKRIFQSSGKSESYVFPGLPKLPGWSESYVFPGLPH